MNVTVFEAINITKKYRNTLALNQVSMSVMQGDIYGFIGENGAGKTTMIRLLDKRCKKHLLLQVNDVAAASVLLESKLNTSNFSVMPDKSIHLYDYVENAGKVSALLSANNITIYQLAQSGDSLETYYTNLIGGCQND